MKKLPVGILEDKSEDPFCYMLICDKNYDILLDFLPFQMKCSFPLSFPFLLPSFFLSSFYPVKIVDPFN